MLYLIRLVVLLVIATSCINRDAVKSFEKNQANIPYDAIIVPGFPFEDSTWHDVMKIRVYWSKYLIDRGYTKNVIYSGSAVYSPYIESVIMKEYGKAIGIPEDHIYTEMEAKHSTENLYYSYQLAKNLGFEKVALATDPFQNLLLKSFAKRNDMDVDFLPIVFNVMEDLEKPTPDINPQVAYIKDTDFEALDEKENFFQRFRGTLGKNIDPRLYDEEIKNEKEMSGGVPQP